MISNRPLAIACALSVIMLFASCAAAAEGQPKLPVRRLLITTQNGSEITVNAETADEEAERNLGLMFRKRLKDGDGMLFVYDVDRILSFYMKNTIIPLSIAYISKDGVIMEIHDMQPLDTRPIQSTRSLRYALEVPQGWFAGNGIAVGDRIRL